MQISFVSPTARIALRLITLLGAALAVILGACGGKVIIDQGGEGGVGSSANVGTTVVSSTTNGSAGPGGGSSPVCLSCVEYISSGEGALCPESKPFFEKLNFCACAVNCVPQCQDNVCSKGGATDDCFGCIQKVCFAEFNECANDF